MSSKSIGKSRPPHAPSSPRPASLTHLVDSSVLAAMRYNPDTRELTLTFRRGHGTYLYSDVSPALWSSLLLAPSKGTFLNQVLKPLNLPFRRLPSRDSSRPQPS